MKTKRIGAIVALLIGIALIIIALIAKNRINQAKGEVGMMESSPWGHNPASHVVENSLENKIGSYDEPVFWVFVGGVALVIIGGVMLLRRKKSKKRR